MRALRVPLRVPFKGLKGSLQGSLKCFFQKASWVYQTLQHFSMLPLL